jgi:LuxR family maltose regulon positive regulatory protein
VSTPLLQTKLYLPPARPNLVPRPRLIERLDEGIRSAKLTLISAPAGYGKTTLLSEWFAAGDRPVAWLSLDKGDNDLVSFLTYLVVTLQTINAGIGDDVLSVLQSPQVPSLELLQTLLIYDLAAVSDPKWNTKSYWPNLPQKNPRWHYQ